MALQLNIKSLLASVHILTVMFSFFDFILFFWVLEIIWCRDQFKKKVVFDEKFPGTHDDCPSRSIKLPIS